MKKMNGFFSIIFAVMVFVTCCVPCAAAESADDGYGKYEMRVLTDLGIVRDELKADKSMTRAEFAKILIRFTKLEAATPQSMADVADVEDENVYAPSIRAALDMGFMRFDGKKCFRPGSGVTFSEAAEALVKALGYGPYAVAKNTEAWEYISIADRIGLKLGGKSSNAVLTNGEVVHLLFKALDINLLTLKTYSADKTEYTNKTGGTPLTAWYDINITEGILYNIENGTASVAVDSIGKTSVRIGDGIYSIGATKADDFLGYAVRGYYRGGKDSVEGELVSIIPVRGKNNVISIDADDIVSFKDNVLSVNSENRTQKHKISPSTDIIYNGEAVSAENRDKALNIDCGTVLINEVNFGGVDSVVIVTSYENYVVGAINKERKIIYDKLDNNRKLDLDSNDSSIRITDTNGNRIDFGSLKTGDVVSAAASLGSKRITIVRSNRKISGNMTESGNTGTNTEYIVIDGIAYDIAKNYRESNAVRPNLNTPVSLTLDPWGRVADISAASAGGYKMGILKVVAKPEGLSTKGLSMKIFDLDGKMKIYDAIERVVIDNYRTKNAEDAENVLTAVTGISVYQPIRYMLNSEGLVSNIDTTYYNESAGESEQSLRYIWRSYKNDYTTRGYGTDIQYMYWANKNFGRKFCASQWATLMKLPRQNTADDKFFITESEWVTGRYYYVDALAVGRDNFCADVVIQYYDAAEGSSEGQEIRYGLVTDVVQALDDEGECAYKISYDDAYGGTRTRFVDSNCSITAAPSVKPGDTNTYRISEGDFVCFGTDAAGMVVKAEVIYDVETRMWASDLPHIRSDRTEGIVNCNMEANELFHGYVLQNGTSYIRIAGEKPTEITDSVMDSAYVFHIANSKIYRYNSDEKKLVATDASEIVPFQYSYGDCSEVITGDLGGLTPFVVIYN